MAYSQDIADKICGLMAEGNSLREACRQLESEGGPSIGRFLAWVDERPELADQYTRARAILLEHRAQELLEIADTTKPGIIRTTKADGTVEEKEADMIEHRKLQIDTRKWVLSKLLPKKYGEKLDVNHGGAVNMNHTISYEEGKKPDDPLVDVG